ncbi:MAG: hypothetical protein AUK34_10080 [Ignavibacteria bacterium CG2_30_36_16]|nr:MAG: hypothetical protein AUK34_10080 [Ignavibacteria bacterium CG2_30_36_16]PJB00407.1 MAG: hypothetical protein CO127_08480 [Ignavibacteria bacterium CG_4_9_14_3_um_filter_36_18]
MYGRSALTPTCPISVDVFRDAKIEKEDLIYCICGIYYFSLRIHISKRKTNIKRSNNEKIYT